MQGFLTRGIVVGVVMLTLRVTPSPAATYYVSKSGTDSQSCGAAQSPSGARHTINAGIACLRGGDTLVIGDGTYDESLSQIGGPPGYTTVPIPGGTAGAYTTLRAATAGGVRVRMDPHGGALNYLVYLDGGHHIRLEGLVLDAEQQRHGVRGCVSVGGGPFQLVNLACLGADNGVVGNGTVEVRGGVLAGMGYPLCWSGDPAPGPSYCHGAYLQQDGTPGQWVFDGVTFAGNSGWGVHSYVPGVVVRNSVFRGHYSGGVLIVGPGGEIVNNCFERSGREGEWYTDIGCTGCRQEGNRTAAPGGCGGAVPSTPAPAPPTRPAPRNLRATTVRELSLRPPGPAAGR